MAMPHANVDESSRIQKLLDEISSRQRSDKLSNNKSYALEPAAQSLLVDYVNEVTCAILEESALLALHRGSSEIEAQDINLILVKKLGIEVPGAPKVKLSLQKYKSVGDNHPVAGKRKLEENPTNDSESEGDN